MSNNRFIEKIPRKGLGDYINIIILGMFALLGIFPLYYVVIISFADLVEMSKYKVYLLPLSFDFTAYKFIFFDDKVLKGFIVTIFVTIIGTLFSMLITVSAAYSLSKKTFPFRRYIMGAIVFTMFFWGQLIPYYFTVKSLGLINNLFAMIIPPAINTFYLIIMKNYFQTMPDSIEESAKIDGANDIYILWKIILPISMPILATFVLFYSVERWNDWWYALLFISNPDFRPIQIIMREIMTNLQMTTSGAGGMLSHIKKPVGMQSIKMAMVVVSTVPIALFYPLLQKYFTKGILIGSIKG